jgi:hypothetical protein
MKFVLTRAALVVTVAAVPISAAAVIVHNVSSIPLPSSSTISYKGSAFSITNTSTKAAANALNGISYGAGASGVYGQNLGTNGYGLYGYATSVSSTGVAGIGGASGDGVYGSGGNGIHGVSPNGQAGKFEITDASDTYPALTATTIGRGSAGGFYQLNVNSGYAAVSGTALGAGQGVSGQSTAGSGVGGSSQYGFGVLGSGPVGVEGVALSQGIGIHAIGPGDGTGVTLAATCAPGGGLLFSGVNTTPSNLVSVDCAGNAIFKGSVTQNGNPQLVAHGIDGRGVISYGPRESQPTMEDIGQAQLRDGETFVRFDAAFARTIDARKGYLVFITPNGESRGLYTTHKQPDGFIVHENERGRSNITFDYRIVAKPFDSTQARLPAYLPPLVPKPLQHARHGSVEPKQRKGR